MENPRLNMLLSMLQTPPVDSFVLFAIAKEYEKLGNNEHAFQYYLQIRASDPQYVGLYYHLGKLYEKVLQFDHAVEAYSAGMAVAKQENDPHALSELAGAKLNLVDED